MGVYFTTTSSIEKGVKGDPMIEATGSFTLPIWKDGKFDEGFGTGEFLYLDFALLTIFLLIDLTILSLNILT